MPLLFYRSKLMNHETQQSAVRHDKGASPSERADRLSLAVAFSFPSLRRGWAKVRLLLGQVFGQPKGPDLDLPPDEGVVYGSSYRNKTLSRDALIKEMYASGVKQTKIAAEFNMSQSRVSQIIRGKNA